MSNNIETRPIQSVDCAYYRDTCSQITYKSKDGRWVPVKSEEINKDGSITLIKEYEQ